MDKKFILVVDDDQTIRYSLQRYFTQKDMKVKTLSNGLEVLVMCQYIVPDLIITDIRMPKLDGVTLLKALRNNLATCKVPVIFMSAYPSDENMAEAKDLGAKYFLVKPFPLEYMDNLITKVLSLADQDGKKKNTDENKNETSEDIPAVGP